MTKTTPKKQKSSASGGVHAAPALRLANEAKPIAAADFSRLEIPYGNYPIELEDGTTAIQRFTAKSAQAICAALANSLASKKSKGFPIYHGHPDVPSLAAKYPDKRAYGWIAEARAEADRLALLIPVENERRTAV